VKGKLTSLELLPEQQERASITIPEKSLHRTRETRFLQKKKPEMTDLRSCPALKQPKAKRPRNVENTGR